MPCRRFLDTKAGLSQHGAGGAPDIAIILHVQNGNGGLRWHVASLVASEAPQAPPAVKALAANGKHSSLQN
jgi:hypothetical protein